MACKWSLGLNKAVDGFDHPDKHIASYLSVVFIDPIIIKSAGRACDASNGFLLCDDSFRREQSEQLVHHVCEGIDHHVDNLLGGLPRRPLVTHENLGLAKTRRTLLWASATGVAKDLEHWL